jgi:hypothetical protein
MSDELLKLQEWFAAQCEDLAEVGELRTPWQHRYGITIDTLDNPAWNVGIDLAGTELDGVDMPEYRVDNGDDDWVICNIHDNRFGGVGDPSKLVVILYQFFQLRPRS